jgi:hypothetical protein
VTAPLISREDEAELTAYFAGRLGGGTIGGPSTTGAAYERMANLAYDSAGRRVPARYPWETMPVRETRNVHVTEPVRDDQGREKAMERRLGALQAAAPLESRCLVLWYGTEGAYWARREAYGRRWALAPVSEVAREWSPLLGLTAVDVTPRAVAERLVEEHRMQDLSPKPLRGELLRRLDLDLDYLADRMRSAWHASPSHRSSRRVA